MKLMLLECPTRALAFAHALLTRLGDVVAGASGEDIAPSVVPDVDLVVIAVDAWSEADSEVCRRLRALRPAPPVLVICGPCDAWHRAEALRAGADDLMSVPFDFDELVARAFALVRRSSSHARLARVGSIAVDFVRRQVFVRGDPLATLTLREYDLLAVLIERAGEVVSRRELARRLTSAGAGSQSNVVAVHMSRLREKLGASAREIETVRGKGYRLRRP